MTENIKDLSRYNPSHKYIKKAMIFAAGLGTRLKPVTDSMPKALVKVGGVPMLERVLLKMKDAGIDEVVVNVHHFASQIEDFISANSGFGMKIDISREPGQPLETGGGIRHAAPLLTGCGRFLVHNVDMLSNLDPGWLFSQDDPSSLATLLLTESDEADRYLLFDEGMLLRGWTNVRTGEVRSPFPDFDPLSCRKFSFCGVHILSERVLRLMDKWPERFSIIDFYLAVCAMEEIRGVVAKSLKIIDIGTPEKLAEADALVREGAF